MIDPRVRTENYNRYEILSTFDLPQINKKLGARFENLGQVVQAQAEAFERLSPLERQQDEEEVRIALAKIHTIKS